VEDNAILGKKHCPTVEPYTIHQALDVIPCLYLPDASPYSAESRLSSQRNSYCYIKLSRKSALEGVFLATQVREANDSFPLRAK
jgi:hypothetical protein